MIQPDLDFTAHARKTEPRPKTRTGQCDACDGGNHPDCLGPAYCNCFRNDSLHSPRPQAHARRTDGPTSHEAAASVRGITETHSQILELFKSFGPRTDEQLIADYRFCVKVQKASDSGIRSRRAELVRMGKLRDSGKRELTRSGRNSVVWEIVK